MLFSCRATLYVGKYSTSLYASPSLVHDGVTVVVSDRNKEKTWSFSRMGTRLEPVAY